MRIKVEQWHINVGIRRDCLNCPVARAIGGGMGLAPVVHEEAIAFGTVDFVVGPHLQQWIRKYDKHGATGVQPCQIDLNVAGRWAEIVTHA
jgi:hypothetical protein